LLVGQISRLLLCAGLIFGLALARVPAWAQTPMDEERRVAARNLFNEGLEYADAGRWLEAADRFRRAYAVKPTPEIGYNLATAYLRLGHPAYASQLLRRAADDPNAAPPVRYAASARLAQVLPRLAQLTVRLEAAPGAVAYLDGQPLARALIGVPIPVDPGPHLVQAYRGDGTPVSRRITVAEGGQSTVVLDAPPPALVVAAPARKAPTSLVRKPWFWIAVAGAAGTALAVALPLTQGNATTGNVGAWQVGDP